MKSAMQHQSNGWTANRLRSVSLAPIFIWLLAAMGSVSVMAQVPTNMVWIPPGTFTMGSPESEVDRRSDEGPQTVVTLTHGFFIGQTEVTQGQYEAVMGSNPSYFTGDLNRPVERVTWYDATNYCGKLTVREQAAGRLPAGCVYRLPTEAEWEYACRVGTTTRFSYGDDPGYAQLGNYAWYNSNSGNTTHAVGLKQLNSWGLYDVHGNVWEWCWDWYGGSLPGGSVADPKGPSSGSNRVFRGGSWYDVGRLCRSAFRDGRTPGSRYYNVGFRAVLDTGGVGSLGITAEPKSLTVPLGAEASFSVQVSGMPLLGFQWFFNGAEIRDATNDVLRLANVLPDFAGGYQVVVSNQYGSATSQVATLTVVYDLEQPLMTSGLAAEYLLDGNVDDASGNGNHGVNVGATSASDRYGKAAGAYDFNGLTSGLYVPNSSTLDIHGKTTLTISAWVKPARLSPATQAIVWKWGWDAQYALCLAKDKVRFVVSDATKDLVSRTALAVGEWRHVAGVYDSAKGKLKLFVNGALDNEKPFSLDIRSTVEPVYIGKGVFSDTYFEGAIDDVRVYSRALSDAEIMLLCNSGVWVTEPPQAQTAIWGRSAALSVTALSTRALSYQWFKDGVLVPGATQAMLAFGELQLADAGAYSVAINNELGGITTPPVALNVIPAEASIALYPGVTIEGVVGKTFAVQYTTDLSEPRTWTTLATITLASPKQLWYDTEPAAQPKRFYRVIAAP